MRINRVAVQAIRERSGLTRTGLARNMQSSHGYINDLETGRRNPRVDTIKRLADALKVPIDAIILLGDSES
jgi:transcriptional regulator with XRE-family HTH domain